MAAGADCIDELDVIRCGGMTTLFDGVYAPVTLGILLWEFTFGHTKQLASATRAHLVALAARPRCWLVRISGCSSTLIRYCGRSMATPNRVRASGTPRWRAARSCAKVSRRWPPRSALPLTAPVVAGIRLRAGKAGSGKGAASMVTEAINTVRAAGGTGDVLVRGDSAYGNSAVVKACLDAGARFSVVLTKNRAVTAAIATIDPDSWAPVRYPVGLEYGVVGLTCGFTSADSIMLRSDTRW
jgi:hypothetical protein